MLSLGKVLYDRLAKMMISVNKVKVKVMFGDLLLCLLTIFLKTNTTWKVYLR
jgi:hypothetical protein